MRRLIAVLLLVLPAALGAQQNRIDVVTPAAPELAAFGPNDIGVRTIQVTDQNRPDILNIKEGGPIVRYDRTLTLEVWYPATLAAGQKPGGEYRVITRYPKAVKAFYMKEDPEDPSKALCVDVLAPEGRGEIIGGSQREEDLDKLLASIDKHGLPREAFDWYLDLRRFGSVPHSGFGLGLERTVGWICGIEHIREAAPFPRMMTRIRP